MALTWTVAHDDAAVGASAGPYTTLTDIFTISVYSGTVDIIDVTGGDNDVKVFGTFSGPFNATEGSKTITTGVGMIYKIIAKTVNTSCNTGF
jgi:hypothetical protein